ncbi:uncharacterized protein EI90DRAFT_3126548 [Cantharellus anzutake]|uniref:uncharacterized protein n=1 Tax=Cantharellus anzutake TaxID=1750568 RepID=UPI00190893E9|nr:uncharacterized protein EI90DRAFT_3126548 [Cantharellus anzutake]KAF8327895.1 hypothetical protein EI90DRAFT_3126548 [Cantharellus anzutake]
MPFLQRTESVTRSAIGSCPDICVSLATQTVLSLEGYILARVTVVDYGGDILLDTLVIPRSRVIDYCAERTGFNESHFIAGGKIRSRISISRSSENLPGHILGFEITRQRVAQHLRGKVVVGHRLWVSLDALRLSHPADKTRDLATYFPLLAALPSSSDQDLQDGFPILVQEFMHRTIRKGFENSVEDARAAMDLYRSCRDNWEHLIAASFWPSLTPPREFFQCYT